MAFSYDYWLSEVLVYQTAFADPKQTEETLGLLVRGICWVASVTVTNHPAHRDEILVLFEQCLNIACERMGDEWFDANIEILAMHTSPPT